jgi:hypothetical protein
MLNKDCVSQLNMANGISESQSQAVLRLFQDAGNANLVELQALVHMDRSFGTCVGQGASREKDAVTPFRKPAVGKGA